MVVPLFSQIVNKQVQPQWIPRHPYPPNVCGNVAKIIPFKESRKLIWFFPLPCFQGDAVKCDVSILNIENVLLIIKIQFPIGIILYYIPVGTRRTWKSSSRIEGSRLLYLVGCIHLLL